jgi:hypothetical protein
MQVDKLVGSFSRKAVCSATAVSLSGTAVAAGRPSLAHAMGKTLHFEGFAGEPLSFEQLALYPQVVWPTASC